MRKLNNQITVNIDYNVIAEKRGRKLKLIKERKERFNEIKSTLKPIPIGEDNIFSGIELKKTAKQRDKDLKDLVNPDLLTLTNVTFDKYDQREFVRGLEPNEKPFPVTPRIDPYEIKNVVLGVKNYYWCSWGMSRSQPFWDESHIGTKFKPIRFRVEENSQESIFLCGCKLSKTAPFCDGKTCQDIKNKLHLQPKPKQTEIPETPKIEQKQAEA